MRPAALAPWLLPLVPLGTGLGIMLAGGAPRSRWVTQLAAGAVALAAGLAARAARRTPAARFMVASAPLGVALIAATLAGEGLMGVHRWIRLGPVLLHPSALFTPALLVLASRRIASHPLSVMAGLGALQAIHVAQPDAGQATSAGVAILVVLLLRNTVLGAAKALVMAALVAGSIAVAWARPDPLPPAPFVEDIVGRAFSLGALVGVLALASLAALAAAPLAVRGAEPGESGTSPGSAVLSVYLICSAAVVLAGEFPVPVLGFGASPVVGTFLGIAALGRAEPARRAP